MKVNTRLIKNITSTVVFIMLAIFTFAKIDQTLKIPGTGYGVNHPPNIQMIYEMPENSIDVVTIGGSTAVYAVSPLEFYGDYGYSAFNLGQPYGTMFDAYFAFSEFLKYQKPKMLLIETAFFFNRYDHISTFGVFDYMKYSPEKILWAYEHTAIDDSPSLLRMIFPIDQFHERWKSFGEANSALNVKDNLRLTYGYPLGVDYKAEIKDFAIKLGETDELANPMPFRVEYAEKIIELCKANDIDIVFYSSPTEMFAYEDMHNFNAAFAEEHNSPFIDFNTDSLFQELGIDIETDFENTAHLNILGAEKLTHYLANFLHETYGSKLQDKRGVVGYEYLDSLFERYLIKKQKAVNYLLPDSYINSMDELPLQENNFGINGMWIDSVNDAIQEDQRNFVYNGVDLYIYGWAVDGNALAPLSELYVRAGNELIRCNYGIERTSVSDYFENDKLKMSGFEVNIPAKWIGEQDYIEFIQICSNDRERYESIRIELIKQ